MKKRQTSEKKLLSCKKSNKLAKKEQKKCHKLMKKLETNEKRDKLEKKVTN